MKNQSIAQLYTSSFHNNWDNLAFSDYEGKDFKYKLSDGFQYYKDNELASEGFVFEEWEREEMCVISYTSGTSGFTKGVMIPERSLVSNIVFAHEHMPLKSGDKIVSFLPMAHVYGLLFEFLFPVTLGCHITFLSNMATQRYRKQKAKSLLMPESSAGLELFRNQFYRVVLLSQLQFSIRND